MRSVQLFMAILLIPAISSSQPVNKTDDNTKNMESTMSANQKNKKVIQRLYEQSLNKRNLELLQEIVSEEYAGISGTKGAAGFREPVEAILKAIPDAQWKIQELFGEGDKIFVRWKFEGTHSGPFQHIAATGNSVSNDGMAVFELKNEKITAGRVYTDRLGFLQQLEVLPADLTSLSNGKASHNGNIRFIDKFFVPANAIPEFKERVDINRNFIKNLPDFIEDAAYERTDEKGNLIFITVAIWENNEALKKAKEAVQAKYKKEGFDMTEMFERLDITIDRGMYKEAALQP